MPSSGSKRARRSGSDSGRSHGSCDGKRSLDYSTTASYSTSGSSLAYSDSSGSLDGTNQGSSQESIASIQEMFRVYKETVMEMVLSEQPRSEANENALPCPFQRRNPQRYAYVKDPACNGRGFKDIADLRDHIKRAHSSKYGCHYCKERFQGRDNQIEDTAKQHRARCKRYTNQDVVEVSRSKPEVMSPDDDSRYFRLDFRRKSYKGTPSDKQREQYWEICKAIWPEYESRDEFSKLDLRNKAGKIPVARLSEIMEHAMGSVDIVQILRATTAAQYQSRPSEVPRYMDDEQFQAVGDESLESYEDEAQEVLHYATEDQSMADYEQPASLYSIPQPTKYVLRNPRDSAYGSNQADDCSRQFYPDLNCYKYTDSGDQMLTEDDDIRSDVLMGISTRDALASLGDGDQYGGDGWSEGGGWRAARDY